VRNILHVKHRVTKERLPLFFVDLEPQNNNEGIFKLHFLQHCKISIESPRRKHTIIQCTRCQVYDHSKSYSTRPFNCATCGGSHDTTTHKKTRETPAKCVLCNGNHPANCKGCTVYRDLKNSRNKDNPRKNINPRITHNIPHQPTTYAYPTISYAQANTGRPQIQPTNSHNTVVTDQLTTLFNEFLLHKLIGLQVVKKFPAFHGTRRFITALTSVRRLIVLIVKTTLKHFVLVAGD